MTLEKRLNRLEDDLEHLTAVVDGSEEQTREATVAVIGLLVAFLKRKHLLDYDEFAEFLAESADPDDEAEDHVGRLINDMRRIVEFHRDLEAGTLQPYVPLRDRLSAEEIEGIRRRAIDRAALERTTKKAVVRS